MQMQVNSEQGKPYKQKQKSAKNIQSAFVNNITSLTFTLHKYICRVFHNLWTLLQEVISQVFVIKKVQINMCLILDGYGVMTAWNLE